jgi:cystathionine beta-lyase family protein involved in aluminum resistance
MDNFERVSALVVEAEEKLADIFADIDKVSFENTKRIMNSFKEHRVSETMFAASSGYGYDDHGREALDAIWADVMGAEAAFVRHSIVNGTQALTIGLFGLLRPNDIMFSIAGKPYDTLDEVIGNTGKAGDGSLRDFGVDYDMVELNSDGSFKFDDIAAKIDEYGARLKMVFVQRSKGYLNRKTLSVE